MENIEKKEIFKLIIKEFHESELLECAARELSVPLDSKQIVAIYGPRRSGKSFYFYILIDKLIKKGINKERIVYINFEDDRLLPLNYKDLGSFTEAYYELYPENNKKIVYLFFDEIQNIHNWEVFIRRIYDKEFFKIFITGSSSKLLSREIATSLRGRTASYPIYPLNFSEFLRFKGLEIDKHLAYSAKRFSVKKSIGEYFELGGFPEIALTVNINFKKKILKEYFDLLVFRDLAERFSLTNSAMLVDLLKNLFTNITTLFSVNTYYKSIKQNMAVSRETVANYLSAIQETQYFFFLPCFSYSLKVQRANPKKIIAIDNGLRNSVSLRFSADTGKLAENLVGSILIRGEGRIYYWKNKREVDFVVERGKILEAINVSCGEEIERREIESLLEFKEKHKRTRKLLLITKDTEKTEEGIIFIPLWKWLLNS